MYHHVSSFCPKYLKRKPPWVWQQKERGARTEQRRDRQMDQVLPEFYSCVTQNVFKAAKNRPFPHSSILLAFPCNSPAVFLDSWVMLAPRWHQLKACTFTLCSNTQLWPAERVAPRRQTLVTLGWEKARFWHANLASTQRFSWGRCSGESNPSEVESVGCFSDRNAKDSVHKHQRAYLDTLDYKICLPCLQMTPGTSPFTEAHLASQLLASFTTGNYRTNRCPRKYCCMVTTACRTRRNFFRWSQPRIFFWIRMHACLNLSDRSFSKYATCPALKNIFVLPNWYWLGSWEKSKRNIENILKSAATWNRF